MLRERFVVGGNVQAGHATDLGIAKRSHDGAQVVWLDANVAVVDDQNFVARFVHHADELGDFVIDGVAPRAVENANLAFWKIVDQPLKNGDGGVSFIADAEDQLVFRIILAAVARKIFVGFRIQAADRLQVADRRSKVHIPFWTVFRPAKKKAGTVENEQIVDKRG